jgi:outer membrane receptor protein involved in Fe transport
VDDAADLAATINKPLPGGQTIVYYKWYDMFFFGQDEWKVTNNLTLNLGLRYEVPGNSVNSLVDLNRQIVQTAGGDQRFALTPVRSAT